MEGLWLHPPAPHHVAGALDFIVEIEGRTLFAYGGWWRLDGWGVGSGLLFLSGELVPDEGRWSIGVPEGDVWVMPTERSSEKEKMRLVRDDMDFDRVLYLEQVNLLQAAVGDEFDLAPWIGMVLARPRRDAAREARKNSTKLRKVARIFVVNYDMMVIDVLVFDEGKRAATACGTPWLETHADAWIAREDEVDLETVINWIAELQPYGGMWLRGAAVLEAEGSIDDIAVRMFSRGR